MASQLETHLAISSAAKTRGAFARLRRGIEKESLRVGPSGELSRTPHPPALGSPLTHPHITTDFSEAQLELITGVHESVGACIEELERVHRYVYRHIGEELLWSASMPCMLGRDLDIPVGRYGNSNPGLAKTVYRLGLGNRYGRLMQTISGIHYNFSVPDALWPAIAEARGKRNSRDFRTAAYFALIRNFRRYSWLLMYLFGASPALCKSFVKDRPHGLDSFDEGSLYRPYATSLRMGRLGYQSDAQSELHISYNGFREYARTMHQALTRPYAAYERIGVKVNGEYRQLSTSLLQIENEFYGTIRPKRRTRSGERPLVALGKRGVEYVEVRCLDLNPFLPLGIDTRQMRFLDVFLLYCLFLDSPPDDTTESARLGRNQLAVVERGRDPALLLATESGEVSLGSAARALIRGLRPIAEVLDAVHGDDEHSQAAEEQMCKVDDPAQTPSARILAAMKSQRTPFFRFAMNQSLAHRGFFLEHPPGPQELAHLDALTARSLADQAAMERADEVDFDTYLEQFIALPPIADG